MCFVPFISKDKKTGKSKVTPCGKCPACEKRRIQQWTFRLNQSDKKSISSQFITLTYDTQNIPITLNGNLTLDKRDTQLFWKRLRKNSPDNGRSIKYYMVGEYGEFGERPHYHAIVFNADAKIITKSWDKGIVDFGTVEVKSIQYTVGYFSKGSTIPINDADDRAAKFATMSKGLGKEYLTKAMISWHKKDLQNRMYLNGSEGKKVSMPRYYKDKLYKIGTYRSVIEEIPIDTNYDGYDSTIFACTLSWAKYQDKTQQKAVSANLITLMDKNYAKDTAEDPDFEKDLFQSCLAATKLQKLHRSRKKDRYQCPNRL